jgi:hypothetical protein
MFKSFMQCRLAVRNAGQRSRRKHKVASGSKGEASAEDSSSDGEDMNLSTATPAGEDCTPSNAVLFQTHAPMAVHITGIRQVSRLTWKHEILSLVHIETCTDLTMLLLPCTTDACKTRLLDTGTEAE